jgi:hypothetical protein
MDTQDKHSWNRHLSICEGIHSMKTVSKVKIRKSKIKFAGTLHIKVTEQK